MAGDAEFDQIIEVLKTTVAALREAEVPFVLGGSFAAWARGAPRPRKDLDLMLRPQDADRALAALGQAGMRTERPPEEWLVKAWCDGVLVDLIFAPAGIDADDAMFERAETLSVMAIAVPVMAIEDVLITKLCALDEHGLNYTPLLGIVRALREQIDWSDVRARAGNTPFTAAFFTLVRELGIAPVPAAGADQPQRSHVRVVTE